MSNSAANNETFSLTFLPSLMKKLAKFKSGPLMPSTFKLSASNQAIEFAYKTDEPDGLNIELQATNGEYWLDCDGWHEYFDVGGISDEEYATRLFEQLITLLNGQTYLQITKAGKWDYRWELLYEHEAGKKESLGITQLIFFNYFGKRNTKVKTNYVLHEQILGPL